MLGVMRDEESRIRDVAVVLAERLEDTAAGPQGGGGETAPPGEGDPAEA